MAVGITNTANPTSAGTGTTITYSGVDIGAAAHDRIVVLCLGTETMASAIGSATINFGGGALAMNASTVGAINSVATRIFWLQAPVGTTATFILTFNIDIVVDSHQHIAVYNVTGAQGLAASSSSVGDDDADPISSGAITIPSNGGCVAVYAGAVGGSGRTWTGITKGLDTPTGAIDFGTGTSVTPGTPTITVSGDNDEDAALAWVIFNPNASIERLPTQGNLAFTQTAPITAVSSPDIRPDRVDLVISPSQPAIGMSKDLNTIDLVLSTTAPTVASLVEIGFDPARVDLVISPSQAAVGMAASGPDAADLVISTTAPSVSTELGPLISPSVVDLVLSSTAPTLGVIPHTRADPARVDLVISPTAPTVSTVLNTQISPARVDLVISATAPIVTEVVHQGISPAAADLAISSVALNIGLGSDIPTGQLVISSTAPIVAHAGNSAGMSPARVDLVISPSQAAIGTSKDLNSADLVISTTAPQPIIQSGLVIISATADLVISGSQPAIGLSKDLNSANLVISSTVPSVSAATAGEIIPPAGDLTFSSLAPDSGLGSDIPIGQLVLSTTAPIKGLGIFPAADDLVFSSTLPIVAHSGIAPDTPIAIPQGNLVISGSQPAIGLSKDLNTSDLVISTTAPSVAEAETGQTISPARVDLVISATVPTVTESAANNTTFVPDYCDLVISGTAPTSVLAVASNPASVDLVISSTAPSVLTVAVVSRDPPHVDLAISTTAPIGGLGIFPARADLVISTTAPTSAVESGSVTLSPATIDLILSCTTPILLVSGLAAETAIDVGGKARRGIKRRRTGDDDLTEEELRYMFRKLAELKKAKSEREKQKAAKALEIALAQAANDDDAAEVISDTIEGAYGTPIESLTDFSGILRDIELLTAIVRNLERVAKESAQFARDEDDVEALMLAL